MIVRNASKPLAETPEAYHTITFISTWGLFGLANVPT